MKQCMYTCCNHDYNNNIFISAKRLHKVTTYYEEIKIKKLIIKAKNDGDYYITVGTLSDEIAEKLENKGYIISDAFKNMVHVSWM